MPHYTHDPATVEPLASKPVPPGPLPGQIPGPEPALPTPGSGGPSAPTRSAAAADPYPDPHLPE